MPTLADLIADRRTIRVPVNGKALAECQPDEIVTLVYRPSAADLEMEQTGRALREASRPLAALSETLHHLLVSWDVEQPRTDAKGKPVTGADGRPVLEPCPLTVEALGRLGVRRLGDWHEAITRDLFPDRA